MGGSDEAILQIVDKVSSLINKFPREDKEKILQGLIPKTITQYDKPVFLVVSDGSKEAVMVGITELLMSLEPGVDQLQMMLGLIPTLASSIIMAIEDEGPAIHLRKSMEDIIAIYELCISDMKNLELVNQA